MKNKFKILVSLAVLLTLALLAFTGCTKKYYNLDDASILTMSDAIEDVLPSCVELEFVYGGYQYGFLGLAISETQVIVTSQTVPKVTWPTSQPTYDGRVRINGEEKLVKLVYTPNSFVEDEDNDVGFRILTLKPEYQFNVKLNPVKFGDSDNLKLGELLFGVSYHTPTDPIDYGFEDYLKVISVMVSSQKMIHGSRYLFGLSEKLEKATFTTNGYFEKSYANYSHKFSTLEDSNVDIVDGERRKLFTLTNSWIFNRDGEFVGMNYLRKIDGSTSNNEVVVGIGYACRSNAIKEVLNKTGIKVS